MRHPQVLKCLGDGFEKFVVPAARAIENIPGAKSIWAEMVSSDPEKFGSPCKINSGYSRFGTEIEDRMSYRKDSHLTWRLKCDVVLQDG
ncbi:hypothetical protein [Roseiconus nitratireducens]|uniref:hypothetical protein n=1 Tax=Roseiconus nitratireducens TaxID=2605748 RepID=UPI001375582F|nr:hypothetical protein [Roseiconus nitratireducens]